MKRILVTGATGQIGSELVPALRNKYGVKNVVAGLFGPNLTEDLQAGPSMPLDIRDRDQIKRAIREFNVDSIFHMASILSALGEKEPELAWQVNVVGLRDVFEIARGNRVRQIVVPSSMAAFGPDAPKDNTPNETILRPATIYGISKVLQELLGNYYSARYGLDVRGVRLPGIMSWKTEPLAGTTDYATAMFYGALKANQYTCYLKADTRLPMMYMPDCIKALMDLAEADPAKLLHRTDFNVNAMSFTPAELAAAIVREIPGFSVDYEIDPMRQAIADSWPRSLDDSAARQEWGWRPAYDLAAMVKDMIVNLRRKLVAS